MFWGWIKPKRIRQTKKDNQITGCPFFGEGSILTAKVGANIELHQDDFADDSPDTTWLPQVEKWGWCVLTKDKAIQRVDCQKWSGKVGVQNREKGDSLRCAPLRPTNGVAKNSNYKPLAKENIKIMSYDLDVYAPDETPVDKTELAAALHKRGWSTVFLHPDAFWKEEVWPFLQDSGPLSNDEILLAGWPLNNELAPQLAAFVRDRNFKEFKALAESTMVLVVCSLSPTIPYDMKANFSEEEWQEFQDASPDSAAMQSGARSYYYLRTGGGRSPFALDFQHAAWDAIAEITGGIAENPQEGAFDWEGMMGEKMGLFERLKMMLLNWRLQRARKKYGL